MALPHHSRLQNIKETFNVANLTFNEVTNLIVEVGVRTV